MTNFPRPTSYTAENTEAPGRKYVVTLSLKHDIIISQHIGTPPSLSEQTRRTACAAQSGLSSTVVHTRQAGPGRGPLRPGICLLIRVCTARQALRPARGSPDSTARSLDPFSLAPWCWCGAVTTAEWCRTGGTSSQSTLQSLWDAARRHPRWKDC